MSEKESERELNDLLELLDEDEVETDKPTISSYEKNKKLSETLSKRKNEEFETNSQFKRHNHEIRSHIIEELKSKKKVRAISYWVIVVLALLLMGATWTFLFLKSDTAHISLLITVTVAAFGNMLTLVAIIFRYVFSSTTELTDYAKILLENENNGNGI